MAAAPDNSAGCAPCASGACCGFVATVRGVFLADATAAADVHTVMAASDGEGGRDRCAGIARMLLQANGSRSSPVLPDCWLRPEDAGGR